MTNGHELPPQRHRAHGGLTEGSTIYYPLDTARNQDPYSQSSESEVITYSKTDGLSDEEILAILKHLVEYK